MQNYDLCRFQEVIELRARSALGLHLKLQPTRSDLVGLRPMARQAAARGRLRAAAAGPVSVACRSRRAVRLRLWLAPDQSARTPCPCRPSLALRRAAAEVATWQPEWRLGKRRRVMPQGAN